MLRLQGRHESRSAQGIPVLTELLLRSITSGSNQHGTWTTLSEVQVESGLHQQGPRSRSSSRRPIRVISSPFYGSKEDNSNDLTKNVTENLKNVLREPQTEMATAQQSLMAAITQTSTQHRRSSRIHQKWKAAISWDRRLFRTAGGRLGLRSTQVGWDSA